LIYNLFDQRINQEPIHLEERSPADTERLPSRAVIDRAGYKRAEESFTPAKEACGDRTEGVNDIQLHFRFICEDLE